MLYPGFLAQNHMVNRVLVKTAKVNNNFIKLWKKSSKECVVPENIHTPPRKGLEFPGGWGGQRPRKILRGGGCCINLYYFFQTGSIIPKC